MEIHLKKLNDYDSSNYTNNIEHGVCHLPGIGLAALYLH
jgi:hypothetical protein